MSKKLFIGSLSWDTTDQGLSDLFAQVGTVVSAKVITDRYTGKARGFGFVEMETEEEAQKAIAELNGKTLDGRQINVSEARPQENRPDRPFQSQNRSFGGGGRDDRRGGGQDRRNRY